MRRTLAIIVVLEVIMAEELNRRNFLKAAALAAGPAIISARGANDKVNIGWIGVGTRGYAALDWLHTAAPNDVQITAICDTYQGYIARAKDRMQTVWGTTPETYKDYHELLADKIDRRRLHHDAGAPAPRYGDRGAARPASTSTSRSRWPTPSKKAGTSSRRGRSPARSCQVGTQNRSSSLYKKAKELVQQGMIGDVHFVRAFWYRNGAAQRALLALRDSRRGHAAEHRLEPVPRHRAQARLGSASLLPVAPLLGLFGRHLDRPAGAPDRHRQLHARQDGAEDLHGVGRHLPLDRQDDDRDVPDTFSAIYDYPTSCRSTTAATSATSTSATASSCAATKAPSR